MTHQVPLLPVSLYSPQLSTTTRHTWMYCDPLTLCCPPFVKLWMYNLQWDSVAKDICTWKNITYELLAMYNTIVHILRMIHFSHWPFILSFLTCLFKEHIVIVKKVWSSMSVVVNRQPPNCYSFTMCFGWVSSSLLGLVSMPTIHRQLGHSLVQFFTFAFIFGAVCILTFCRLQEPRSLENGVFQVHC